MRNKSHRKAQVYHRCGYIAEIFIGVSWKQQILLLSSCLVSSYFAIVTAIHFQVVSSSTRQPRVLAMLVRLRPQPKHTFHRQTYDGSQTACSKVNSNFLRISQITAPIHKTFNNEHLNYAGRKNKRSAGLQKSSRWSLTVHCMVYKWTIYK